MNNTISGRIDQASAILGITASELKIAFTVKGDPSDELIEIILNNATESEILESLSTRLFISKTEVALITAVKILKRDTINQPTEQKSGIMSESSLEKILNSTKPIANWSDAEVLNSYMESESQELEYELNKRSKGRRFVVLTKTNTIDVDATLLMLKRARKEEIPAVYKTPDNDIIRIYRIEEYHPENRERYVSPLRPQSILFDGYCADCGLNFSKVGNKERQFMRLVYESTGKQSKNAEIFLLQEAEKGLNNLFATYPELVSVWEKKDRTDSLPKLIVYESPTAKVSDPFNPSKKIY
jgi:hypothetical protein